MTSPPSVSVDADELAERLKRFAIFPFHVRESFSRPEVATTAAAAAAAKPGPLLVSSLDASSLEPCFLCLAAGDCAVDAAFGSLPFLA